MITETQSRFLNEYLRSGMLHESARRADVSMSEHYRWLTDADYAEAFERTKTEMLRRFNKIADAVFNQTANSVKDRK